ncbi:winged helix-turn-helix domain-containing protein [Kribbella sp. NPDC050241]|uniref:winged helix-turn-helix domain-containing protein n=1 Tax=Kribbella sp. NPDC050241 TaxID=3364115 RepID=UPI0037BCECA5
MPKNGYLQHYEASYNGSPVDLTPREFEFLAFLALYVGKVCTRRMILEHVWGPAYAKQSHYLKVYAYRILRSSTTSRVIFSKQTLPSATACRDEPQP